MSIYRDQIEEMMQECSKFLENYIREYGECTEGGLACCKTHGRFFAMKKLETVEFSSFSMAEDRTPSLSSQPLSQPYAVHRQTGIYCSAYFA